MVQKKTAKIKMYKASYNFIMGVNLVCKSKIWRRLDNRKLRDNLVLKSFKSLGLNIPKFVWRITTQVPFTLSHGKGLHIQTRIAVLPTL